MSNIVRFYIPDVGTKIRLAKDWMFDLYRHPSNVSLGESMGIWRPQWSKIYLKAEKRWDKVLRRALVPMGTVLKIRRVHLGTQASIKRSMTFYVAKGDSPNPVFEKTQFWAPLIDVNNIACEILDGPKGKTSMCRTKIIDSRWDLL